MFFVSILLEVIKFIILIDIDDSLGSIFIFPEFEVIHKPTGRGLFRGVISPDIIDNET